MQVIEYLPGIYRSRGIASTALAGHGSTHPYTDEGRQTRVFFLYVESLRPAWAAGKPV